MKTKTFLILNLVMGIVFTGCVTSLHPLYTEKDLTFDRRLIGTWKPVGEEGETWKLESLLEQQLEQYKDKPNSAEYIFKKVFVSDKTYILTHTENGKTAKFDAYLVNLDGQLYLDMLPAHGGMKNNLIEDHFLPVHTYVKVNIANNNMELQFFNAQLLYELLDKNNVRIKHESVDGQKVITASTEELQRFIKKFANYKDLFLNPVVMKKNA